LACEERAYVIHRDDVCRLCEFPQCSFVGRYNSIGTPIPTLVHAPYLMNGLYDDILFSIVVPFLTMRDVKTIRSVSKYIHDRMSPVVPISGLDRYICSYLGCPNRAFLLKTVNPFIPYTPPDRYSEYSVSSHVIMSICLFPLYSVSFYRILYILVRHEVASSDVTAAEMEAAFEAYRSVDDCVYILTETRSMDICTCADRIENHSGQVSTTCSHIGTYLHTDQGFCIQCMLTGTRNNGLSFRRDIPCSFYVYLVIYGIVPICLASCIILPSVFILSFLPCMILGPSTIRQYFL
jgi:hypothetical protein